MQIYMPHSGVADKEVEETYDKIEDIVEKEKRACVILMGDWNAVFGEGEDERTVGRHGLPHVAFHNSPLSFLFIILYLPTVLPSCPSPTTAFQSPTRITHAPFFSFSTISSILS